MISTRLAAFLLLLTITATTAEGQSPAREPYAFFKTRIGLTDVEIRKMERGQVITKILQTPVENEVAVFGAVWVKATTDDFVEQYRNIESFEQGDSILNTKKLSEPPRLADLTDLTYPEEDLDALSECGVGDCDVIVDEPALLRLQEEVDWSAEDAHDQANELIRTLLFDAVQSYREGGDRAFAAYRDKKRPTFLDEEFDDLLESSSFLVEYIPELHRYLDEFPNRELPGSDSFLYWSKAELGLRPTIRLNHVVIYPLEEGRDASVVIASKMLYASHYFHTALELRFLVRDSARPTVKGFYLISLNRSRSDGLTDTFGGIVRVTAERRTRSALAKYLERSKKHLEDGN
jgi:hypothetical protein